MKKFFRILRAIIEGLNEDIHNRHRAVVLVLLFALALSLTACGHNRRGDHGHNRRGDHGHKHHYTENYR